MRCEFKELLMDATDDERLTELGNNGYGMRAGPRRA